MAIELVFDPPLMAIDADVRRYEIMGYPGSLSNSITDEPAERIIHPDWPDDTDAILSIDFHCRSNHLDSDVAQLGHYVYAAPHWGTAVPGSWSVVSPAGMPFTPAAWSSNPDQQAGVWWYDAYEYLADYIDWSGNSAASSRNVYTNSVTEADIGANGYIDVRFLCRKDDWDDPADPSYSFGYCSSQWSLAGSLQTPIGGGPQFHAIGFVGFAAEDGDSYVAIVPTADLGLVDGAWTLVTARNNPGLTVTFTATPGNSVTVPIDRGSIPVDSAIRSSGNRIQIGNSGNSGSGFNGDIADFEIYENGGGLLTKMDLSKLTGPRDYLFTNDLGHEWRRGGGLSGNPAPSMLVGTTSGEYVLRYTLDFPFNAHAVRAGFEAGSPPGFVGDIWHTDNVLTKLVLNAVEIPRRGRRGFGLIVGHRH